MFNIITKSKLQKTEQALTDRINQLEKRLTDIQYPPFKYGDQVMCIPIPHDWFYVGKRERVDGIVKHSYNEQYKIYGYDAWRTVADVDTGAGIETVASDKYTITKINDK